MIEYSMSVAIMTKDLDDVLFPKCYRILFVPRKSERSQALLTPGNRK
jgi:hypothetical protein